MCTIQVNLPRAAIALPDGRLDEILSRRPGAAPPILAGLVRPALAGMASHLPSLAGTPAAELQATWYAMMRMRIRGLAEQPVDGTSPRRAISSVP